MKIIKSAEELNVLDDEMVAKSGLNPHWFKEAKRIINLAIGVLKKDETGVSTDELQEFFKRSDVFKRLGISVNKQNATIIELATAALENEEEFKQVFNRELLKRIEDRQLEYSKKFAEEMLKLGLSSKEALQLAVQTSSGCAGCKDTINTIRSVYFLLTTGEIVKF